MYILVRILNIIRFLEVPSYPTFIRFVHLVSLVVSFQKSTCLNLFIVRYRPHPYMPNLIE